jgi:hypothetical protein
LRAGADVLAETWDGRPLVMPIRSPQAFAEQSIRGVAQQGCGRSCQAAFDHWAAYAAALCCLGHVVGPRATQGVSEIFGHAGGAITQEVSGHVSPDVSRDALTGLSDALG